ncbi:MAG TPA: hypothetical protein VI076_06175 [Actinopolymorphaceae bacterium]
MTGGTPGTANAADAQGPSDDRTLLSVTVEGFEPGRYFGDARLDCPVFTTVGGRFELDGQEVKSFWSSIPVGSCASSSARRTTTRGVPA